MFMSKKNNSDNKDGRLIILWSEIPEGSSLRLSFKRLNNFFVYVFL